MKCHNCNKNFEEKDMFELKEPMKPCVHCHSDLYEENVFCSVDCLIEYLNKKLPHSSFPLKPENLFPRPSRSEDITPTLYD